MGLALGLLALPLAWLVVWNWGSQQAQLELIRAGGVVDRQRSSLLRRLMRNTAACVLIAALLVVPALVAGIWAVVSGGDAVLQEDLGRATPPRCVALRNDWRATVFTDEDHAAAVRQRYESSGCRLLCGGLVEDRDTPKHETRCD